MPSIQTTQPALNHPQRVDPRRRAYLDRLRDAIIRHSHAWDEHDQRVQTATRRLSEAEAIHADQRSRGAMRHVMLLVALVCVTLLETLFTGPILEHHAQRLFHSKDIARWFSFLGPLGLALLDLWVALNISRRELHRIPGERGLTAWHLMRWGLLLFVAGISASTQLEAHAGEPLTGVLWLQIAPMIVLPMLLHVPLLYAGGAIDEALAYGEGAGRCWSRTADRDTGAGNRGRAAQLARDSFNRYRGELDQWSIDYPQHPIAAGPFDAVSKRVLRQIYGAPVIQDADNSPATDPASELASASAAPDPGPQPQSAQPTQPTKPAPSPVADARAEADYYRRLAQGLVQAREGEVRPEPVPQFRALQKEN